MRKTLVILILVITAVMASLTGVDVATAQEAFIGEIRLFAGNFAPRGWALCDGQLLPISQYQALFSILGTTYGGDEKQPLRCQTYVVVCPFMQVQVQV